MSKIPRRNFPWEYLASSLNQSVTRSEMPKPDDSPRDHRTINPTASLSCFTKPAGMGVPLCIWFFADDLDAHNPGQGWEPAECDIQNQQGSYGMNEYCANRFDPRLRTHKPPKRADEKH